VLEKIVVGYAGDQAGRDAVALAGRIAAAVKGGLTIVFPYHPLLARETSEHVQERVQAEVRRLLDAIEDAEEIEPPTYHWSPSSWPIHALHELAAYERAELIVLGAARETLGDRLQVSLMERMVHGAPCAIAVAPAGYAQSLASFPPATAAAEGSPAPERSHGLRRIGVGFSSSNEGRAAVTLARELAGRLGGSVQVIAGAGLEPALASYAFSSPALGEVEDELYADTEQTLTRVCEELGVGDGIPIEHETIRGDPASVLVERSSELDLLVLGSRAYGPLRHVLLGSVSARVMREARCPVLVVPRGVGGGDGHAEEQTAGAARHA
jgi:nucleotide-binding universal stress UspA family protein